MRIRKKEPSVGILGKIVNSFTNSKNDTYSAAYLNKKIEVVNITTAGTNLDDYTETGAYFFKNANVTPTNIPEGINGWLVVLHDGGGYLKQIWYRFGSAGNHFQTFVRTKIATGWTEWKRFIIEDDIYYKNGDTYVVTNSSLFLGGVLTSSGGKIATTIFTNKSLSKITKATIDNFNIYVRKDNGGYLLQTSKDDFVANGGSFKATIVNDNAVCLEWFGDFNSPTNNTPVGIELANLKLTFNE